MIWRFSLPGPRYIGIKFRGKHRPFRRTAMVGYADSPAQLYACRNSRHIALTRYKLTFGLQLVNPVYFDKRQDWLLVVEDREALTFMYVRDRTIEGEEIRDNCFPVSATEDINIKRVAFGHLLERTLYIDRQDEVCRQILIDYGVSFGII